MKYKISIPSPKTKKITVTLSVVYNDKVTSVNLEEFGDVEFDVPDGYQWKYENSSFGGNMFLVEVTYTNSKGKEKKEIIVPERVMT